MRVVPRSRVREWTRALRLRALQGADGLGDSLLSPVESVIVRQGEQVEAGVDGRCQVGKRPVERGIAGVRAKGIERELQVCKRQVVCQEHVSDAAVDVMEVLHLVIHIMAHDVADKSEVQLSRRIGRDHCARHYRDENGTCQNERLHPTLIRPTASLPAETVYPCCNTQLPII